MNIFYFISIITVLFILWVEYSVGYILIRPSETGKYTINFISLFSFMINPFHKLILWDLNMIDINYPFIMIYSLIIYYLIFIL